MTVTQVAVAACGVPGHLPDLGPDLEEWARSQLARYDTGSLSPWHVGNCRRVCESFFDSLGRVLFGAATADELDDWLNAVRQQAHVGATVDPLVTDALIRVRSSRCRGLSHCRCVRVVARAEAVMAELNGLGNLGALCAPTPRT